MADLVTLQVRRYRPEDEGRPSWQSYEVPARREWMVLDALNYVKDEVDGSLSFRWSCRMGVCGSCGMTVNGEPVLTCAAYLSRFAPGPVKIEPLKAFPVIRDLVVEIRDFLAKLKRVKPWIIRRPEEGEAKGGAAAGAPAEAAAPIEGEYLQTPEELFRYKQYSMCINCLLCYAACPIVPLEPEFLGPAAIALAQRYNLDSRDHGNDERMDALSQHEGIWGCTFVGECSVVCPKHVDPAGAIQRYKLDATLDWFRSLVWPRGARRAGRGDGA